jgi:GNAT superfamily N-acetyltransferase
VIEIRPVCADRAPAAALLAAMVVEIIALYGPLEDRNAPTATPEELWAPGGTYLVLFEDGAAVAGGGIKALQPGIGEIKRMYVDPAARGRGHARRLLGGLEAAGRQLGLTHLRLDTGPKQPVARALYERAGYRSIPAYNENYAASFWGEKEL